jgi:hypothetical protein
MQAGAQQQIAGMSGHGAGRERTAATAKPAAHAAFAASVALSADTPALFLLPSGQPLQMRGWARKAPEFINSGPPALLNNPCRSRRITVGPFLKHAMEVHYG